MTRSPFMLSESTESLPPTVHPGQALRQQQRLGLCVLSGASFLLIQAVLSPLELPLSSRLLVTGLLLYLLLLRRWTSVVLLVLVQLDLLFREPRRVGFTDSLAASLFVLTVLCMLMFGSRYHTCRELTSRSSGSGPDGRLQPPVHSWWRRWQSWLLPWDAVAAARDAADHREAGPERAPAAQSLSGAAEQQASPVTELLPAWLLSAVRGAGLLLLSTLLARWLLGQLPVRGSWQVWLSQNTDGTRELWPGPTLLTLMLALCVLISEFTWRQTVPGQARMYLRTVFVNEHYRDLRMIVRRRLQRRRAARQARPPAEGHAS